MNVVPLLDQNLQLIIGYLCNLSVLGNDVTYFMPVNSVTVNVCVFPACHHHIGSGEIRILSEEQVALRSKEEPGQKSGRLALVSQVNGNFFVAINV